MSAHVTALLFVAVQAETVRFQGIVLLGLIVVITLALALVLFLISREARKESEEMRRLITHMRRLKERRHPGEGLSAGAKRRARRRKGGDGTVPG